MAHSDGIVLRIEAVRGETSRDITGDCAIAPAAGVMSVPVTALADAEWLAVTVEFPDGSSAVHSFELRRGR